MAEVTMNILPSIDETKCTLCGDCIEMCPKDMLTVIDDKIRPLDEGCMQCSHCYSICAQGAVSFNGNLHRIGFRHIEYCEKADEKIAPDCLINFFRSRRSIRKYSDMPVDDDLLSDLVEFAVTAPSGSNCQAWEFTVINGREKVFDFARKIQSAFEKLNKIAGNPITRYLSVIVSGRKLINYYKNHYDSVEMGLAEAAKGRDLLFHGAPSLILVHSPMDGSLPIEDAQYAAYNITLLAHALGLGTCFIGYASETLNSVKQLKKAVAIPKKNRVHAALIVGYPDVSFRRHALRKDYHVNFL